MARNQRGLAMARQKIRQLSWFDQFAEPESKEDIDSRTAGTGDEAGANQGARREKGARTRSKQSRKPRKRKKPRKPRRSSKPKAVRRVTFRQLIDDSTYFDSLGEQDRRYVEHVIEQRKREIQKRWTAEEELKRRLGNMTPDFRQFNRSADGRLVENIVTEPIYPEPPGLSGDDP